MASTTSALRARQGTSSSMPAVSTTVLARLACDGGASKAEMLRDTTPLLLPKLSHVEARLTLERALAALVLNGHAREDRARFMGTDTGLLALSETLGLRAPAAKLGWIQMRDVWLVAKALGLSGEAPSRLKRLAKPDGLRAAIVQQAHALPARPDVSPSRLRSQLAVIALERAFGNKVKSGFDQRGLSAKAGRLLAGQLAGKPRDYGTDGRLIAALAAEHAGATKPDAEAVRLAVLRRWLGSEQAAEAVGYPTPQVLRPVPFVAANDAASARPDLGGFAEAVLKEARPRAEGWPGNRKAFICHVWQAIRSARPEWRLTEIEFKCMLAEAHRAGLVVLANADLRDKRTVKEVQDSVITYMNTVWHLVRVEE